MTRRFQLDLNLKCPIVLQSSIFVGNFMERYWLGMSPKCSTVETPPQCVQKTRFATHIVAKDKHDILKLILWKVDAGRALVGHEIGHSETLKFHDCAPDSSPVADKLLTRSSISLSIA